MSDLYSLIHEGHRYIEREEWERAFDVLRRAEELDAQNLEVVHCLATVTFHLGRFAEASRYYRRLLELNPSSSELLVGLASCWFYLGRNELVVELCERAVLLDPQEYDGYSYGAAAALSLGQHDAASELAEKGLRWFPDDVELHANLGIAAFHRGDGEVAEFQLRCALELDDTRAQPAAYLLRLVDRRSCGESPLDASACWGVRVRPWDAAAAREGRPSAADGRPRRRQDPSLDAVEAIFSSACERIEESALLHLWMGEAYLRRGYLQEAADRFKEAGRIDPELPGPAGNLAMVYCSLGMPRRAIAYWQRELDLDPTRPHVLAGLGDAHEQLGERRAAANCFRQAADIASPGHARTAEWLRQIDELERWGEKTEGSSHASQGGRSDGGAVPATCRRCQRRVGQMLRASALCRPCFLLSSSLGLLIVVYVVNLIAVVAAGWAILLGQSELFLALGGRIWLAMSGAVSTAAVMVSAFASSSLGVVAWREGLTGRRATPGIRVGAAGQRDFAAELTRSFGLATRELWRLTGAWRERHGARSGGGEPAQGASGVAAKGRQSRGRQPRRTESRSKDQRGPVTRLVDQLLPFPGALALVPLFAFLLYLAPSVPTVLALAAAAAVLFAWGLLDWLVPHRFGPRAVLRTFLGDLLAPAGRHLSPEVGAQQHDELRAGRSRPQWRHLRIAVAAALLIAIVLVAGSPMPAGHSLQESWPAAWRLLEVAPYLALVLLGLILALAVDDLDG